MSMNLPFKGSNLTNVRCDKFINKKQKKLLNWLKVAKRSVKTISLYSDNIKLSRVYRRRIELSKSVQE
jgi:hypothetical protein